MHPTRAALAVLSLVFAAQAQEAGGALARSLADPPATGLLVALVAEGSQAERVGIAEGDVIVSFGGAATPDIAAFRNARQEAAGTERADCLLARPDGTTITVRLGDGQIGVTLLAVMKGRAVEPLPPATDVVFDVSALAEKPLDEWFAFSLDGGATKAGFEHGILRFEDGRLHLRREVAFDGGAQWGINHFDVTLVVEGPPSLAPQATRFSGPLTGWLSTGRRVGGEDGTDVWEIRTEQDGADAETKQTRLPAGVPVVPSYLLDSLARFMPQEAGACFRFRMLEEGAGALGMASALVAVAEEEVGTGAGKVKAWRFETRQFGGGVSGTYWVDANRRLVKIDYGGAVCTPCSREKALAGLHPELRPRSAD